MRKRAILGCGYIGAALAKKWENRDFELTVTTTTPARVEALSSIADRVVLLDGSDCSAVRQLCTDLEVLVISVAPKQDYRTAYLDTAHCVARAIEGGARVKQIIYTGSASVYGDRAGEWVDETADLHPNLERQAILIETEQTLLAAGTDVCVFRLGEIYGPGREIEDRLRRMNGKALAGKGDNITNLIHRDDIVSAIDFAVEKELSGVFNLCNYTHLRRDVFYQHLCAKHAIDVPTWDPGQASFHGGRRMLTTKKLEDCGFEFAHPEYDL